MGYPQGYGPGFGPGYGTPLYACPACHGPVAATAASCPHCGYRPPVAVTRNTTASIGLGLGAGLIAAGSFLPWATISGVISVSVNGVDDGRDGVFTLGIAIVLGLLAIVSLGGRGFAGWLRVLSILGGLAAAAIAAYDGADLARLQGAYGDYLNLSVGIGIYVIVAGGVVTVIAALLSARK